MSKTLTKHQILDHLEEIEADMHCQSCGNDKWLMLIDDPPDKQNLTTFMVLRSDQTGSLPVINMFCKKCGLLRSYYRGMMNLDVL